MHHVWILGHELRGTFSEIGGWDRVCPRRVVLDKAIAEAAMDAGAEIRFGTQVRALIGSGTEDDPVTGVELEDGTRIEAPSVYGADGRASSVAGMLDLAKREPRAWTCRCCSRTGAASGRSTGSRWRRARRAASTGSRARTTSTC